MKLTFIKSASLSLAVFSMTMVGCLKDKGYDDGTIQSVHGGTIKPIEIKLTAANSSNFLVAAIDNSDNDTTFNLVPINLATADVASEDIHVTIAVDSNLVKEHNDNNDPDLDVDYDVPPASMYTIVDPVVIIPKGSHTGYLQIKLKPSDFIGGDWALGFKIASVQEQGYAISGNLGTGVTAIAIKNQYDGVYLATGTMVHPSLGGTFTNQKWTMVTTGATSVTFGLNTTVLFAVNITLTVNADNSVDLSTPDVVLVPYDKDKNYYDPATKTFHVDFGYSGNTRHVTATAVYSTPR